MQKERKDIPLEKFVITVTPPLNRLSNLSVYIHQDGRINLNAKLLSEINQKYVTLQFTEDYKAICISVGSVEKDSFGLPKSGTIKTLPVVESLLKKGILLPAQYNCWYSENYKCWQGMLHENPMKKPAEKRPNMQIK